MQQPFPHPQDARATYEYTIQATEDRHEEELGADAARGQTAPVWRGDGTPNYKPTPLRWPFISVVIALLMIAIVLVVVAEKHMPDSDNNVTILGIHPNASQPVRLRVRDDLDNSSAPTTAVVATTEVQIPETILTLSEEGTTQAPDLPSTSSDPLPSMSSSVSDAITTSLNEEGTMPVQSLPSTSSEPLPSMPPSFSDTITTSSPSPISVSRPDQETISSVPSSPMSVSRPDQETTSSIPPSPSASDTGSNVPDIATQSTTVLVSPSQIISSTGLNIPNVATDSTTLPLSSSRTVISILDVPTISSETATLSVPSSKTTISILDIPNITSETTPLSVSSSRTLSSAVPPISSSSSVSLPSGATLIPVSVSVSTFTTNITAPPSTVTYTSEFTTTTTVPFTTLSSYSTTFVSSYTSLGPTTFQTFWSSDGSQGTVPVSTGTQTQVVGTTVATGVTTTVAGVSTITSVGTVTRTSTIAGVVIPSVGEVTITYYNTVYPPNEQPVTRPPDPVTATRVQVIDGTTVAVVQTQAPVILVVPSNEVKTQVIKQDVSTGVARVGGSVVTNVVVITPSPGVPVDVATTVGGKPVTVVNTPDPVTVVRLVDGTQRTIVENPPPQTVISMEGGVVTTINTVLAPLQVGQPVTYTLVNNEGGTPVTQVVVTTPAGPPYEPISYTVVRESGGTFVKEVVVTTPTGPPGQPITFTAVDLAGGTPVTQVIVTTPTGAPFQPVAYTITTNVGGTPTVVTVTPDPTTIVETIDGTPVTRVTTPPVTSFTTTVGGTLTTQTLATTPTGTEPITLTFVSTSGGTLSTFTTTIPPTTRVTTISGTLRTITSTPSASTSFSTRRPSTRTFTTTSSPTSSATSDESPAPSIIGSTKVYRWTEADIFVGTFLPALLGVALVIPLRIIDLNAKLYQPFQTLAKPGGGSGAKTLLLQYTGMMGFIRPVMTLFEGHPVPFLTTLIVGCASFTVPLATEAIGLKLHGECYLNTASAGCAPALGVSPGPAHALVGLLGAVIVMLFIVLFCMSRWVTGVYANPWSIPGIAALAGNPQIRIQQNGEAAMRRAVAGKQYGLGWFWNPAGREDYGIVLLDEAGRGLQDNHRDGEGDGEGSESDILDTQAAIAKGRALLGNHLPFVTLRYPWRITFALFQLALLIFIIYYHAYYHGSIRDNGRLWLFLNANTFGVRFVSAVIGVIIAFAWQSFFLSVSTITPYHHLSLSPDDPYQQGQQHSPLPRPHTNPFSALFSHPHTPFPTAVAVAAILADFLPVLLANIPFNLTQTATAATVCAVLSCIFLGFMVGVLGWSMVVGRRYPPMPVDPRCVAGAVWYVTRWGVVPMGRDHF